MIIDTIVDETLKNIKDNVTDDYINALYKRVETFMDYTCLPRRYYIESLDETKFSKKLKDLSSVIINCINNGSCIGILNSNFKYTGYTASNLMFNYVKDCLKQDEHIKSILFIDTNLLMTDYKTLMGTEYGKDTYPIMEYSTDVLMRQIYEADFIFWDKFNYSGITNYDSKKLYSILSRRFNNCKGNAYFVVGETMQEVISCIDTETGNVMNMSISADLTKEKYIIKKLGEISNGK